uniref:C-type lectin domain-containing protein n=1 Tax=Haplochromis burtoni TaxID=8153 RepID=A0A3Q2VQ93_HAPBU
MYRLFNFSFQQIKIFSTLTTVSEHDEAQQTRSFHRRELSYPLKMKISALRFVILTVLFKLALGILPGHNHYVSINMTWSDARTYCREHYTDLSLINNQEEEDEKDDASLQQDSWIGLYSDDHDTWKWSGGTNASFFNWIKENNAAANKKCVVFSQMCCRKPSWLA